MVVSRNGTAVVQPCIKESGLPSRPITKRVSELPSLRYGTIGAKTTSTGPLRVTSHYQSDTIPRCATRKTNGRTYPSDDMAYKPIRPPRRVRFTLPATDGDVNINNNNVNSRQCGSTGADRSVVKPLPSVTTPSAGEGWFRTRASTAFSQRSDVRTRERAESVDRVIVTVPVVHYSNTSSVSTFHTSSRHHHHHQHNNHKEDRNHHNYRQNSGTSVPVTCSPGVRSRIHPTGRYIKGTLSPTANANPHAAATPGGQALLRAARDGEDHVLRDLLRRASIVGIAEADLNTVDSSGRTVLSYVASNGTSELLEQILTLPGLDPNKPDNEGNTPLHFAAQAGQVECLNCLITRCRGIEIDSRNNLGFTPLMKAALQGRNKCAKLLLFAGANPTLRDNGRGFRADQWARFCGRYVCADVIEKYARQRLLERSTSYGHWGGDVELGARVLMGKVVPMPPVPQQTSHSLKSKLRKVFRTSSGPSTNNDNYSSARLVTQLTSAALCASSPVLPSGPTVPPVVKSLLRPLTVPKLQITLVNNNGDCPNHNLSNGVSKTSPTSTSTTISKCNNGKDEKTPPIVKPARTKKTK